MGIINKNKPSPSGQRPVVTFHRQQKQSFSPALLWSSMLLVVALIGGAGYLAWTESQNDKTEELVAQFNGAKLGQIFTIHAYGGAMQVQPGSPATITAHEVPSKACATVGWYLAKDGMVIINGVLAPRLSAAKLAEMCSQFDTASISWMPRVEEGR